MEQLVFIVGTQHRFQGRRRFLDNPTLEQLHEFYRFLLNTMMARDVCSVAEEFSLEVTEKYARNDLPPGYSVPRLAVKKLNVPHRYCDPDSARLKELGIPNDESHKPS